MLAPVGDPACGSPAAKAAQVSCANSKEMWIEAFWLPYVVADCLVISYAANDGWNFRPVTALATRAVATEPLFAPALWNMWTRSTMRLRIKLSMPTLSFRLMLLSHGLIALLAGLMGAESV